MKEILGYITESVMKLASSVRWNDVLDIVFVAIMLYYIIKLFRQTRAIHLVKGLILLGVIYFGVSALNLSTSSYIFSIFFRDVIIVLVLLFQNEIRHALESFGRGDFRKISLFSSKGRNTSDNELRASASYIAKAVDNMSATKTGALIVLEGKSPLGEIIETGTVVDSAISVPVIENVFYPKAPLHDGAMIIRDNRVYAAACILPLTQSAISRDLGTRHRAAIGMSENSDAMIIVVSEETGIISVVHNAVMTRNVEHGELNEIISNYLISDGKDTFFSSLSKRRKNRDEK